jgi:hypothetical protein
MYFTDATHIQKDKLLLLILQKQAERLLGFNAENHKNT